MDNKSKDIEQEINNVTELILHLDKYLVRLKEKEKELKLSDNSKEIIKELMQSKAATNFFCHDEKIKKKRNSIGIIKAIDSMLINKKYNRKNIYAIRKINPISFNQSSLLSNPFYSGAEAEFDFIKNILKGKILDIVKSCFEYKFNLNKKEILNKKNKNNSIDNKYKFILISNNSIKKAKLRNIYYNSLINKKNLNIISMKDYFIRTDISKFLDKKNINNSNISIIDNSINRINHVHKNNSCINLNNQMLNKNSSMTNDKCTSANLKYNTIENSKDNKNKKRNIILLNKKKYYDMEKSFMPLLNVNDFKYKNEVRFKPKKIPTFDSEMMELIHFNTKNNIKAKAEKDFLNECLKETYRSLRKINPLYNSKCFVDYSRSNIIKDNNDIYGRKNYELPLKERKLFNGFEYKNVYKYSITGKLINKRKLIFKDKLYNWN